MPISDLDRPRYLGYDLEGYRARSEVDVRKPSQPNERRKEKRRRRREEDRIRMVQTVDKCTGHPSHTDRRNLNFHQTATNRSRNLGMLACLCILLPFPPSVKTSLHPFRLLPVPPPGVGDISSSSSSWPNPENP